MRQSPNLFRRMRSHLQKAGARPTRETTTEIAMAGGGWATCLPGDCVLRGLSLRHAGEALVIDEAAYVKEELWPTASPMLAAAPNARLIILTTPCGPSGEFHRAFTDEEFEAERITVKAEADVLWRLPPERNAWVMTPAAILPIAVRASLSPPTALIDEVADRTLDASYRRSSADAFTCLVIEGSASPSMTSG